MGSSSAAAPIGLSKCPPRERLDGAVAVAKAAEACAEAGDVGRALTIMLDVEQPLYEATTLLNAASLLHRCAES